MRSSKAKRASAGAVSASRKRKPARHISSPPAIPSEPTGFVPRAVHYRLAEAIERAFQDGKVPSDSVIAQLMNERTQGKTARETVCRWRRMHPEVWEWAMARVRAACEVVRPFVDRRITQLALQGSVEHAKLYYQFVARAGIPAGEGAGDSTVPVQPIINILIPRPQAPNGGVLPAYADVRVHALPTPVPPPQAPTIPTVAVR